MWADGMDRAGSEKLFADPAASLTQKWDVFAPYQ
jgi:hypothetical protein